MLRVLCLLTLLAAALAPATGRAQDDDAMLLIAHPAFRDLDYRQTVLIAAPASAQDYIPVSVVNYAKYDMATQTFTVLPGNPDLNPGDADPVVLYDNSATNGYFTTGSGAIKTHHFMDWGTFTTTPGMGADVTEFRMAYVTNILAPTPVTFRMRFYQGATGNGVDTDSNNVDFRIESDGNANMLFVDASRNGIGIGKSSPKAQLDVVGAMSGNTLYIARSAAFGGSGVIITNSGVQFV